MPWTVNVQPPVKEWRMGAGSTEFGRGGPGVRVLGSAAATLGHAWEKADIGKRKAEDQGLAATGCGKIDQDRVK